jgi:hypothetical protein
MTTYRFSFYLELEEERLYDLYGKNRNPRTIMGILVETTAKTLVKGASHPLSPIRDGRGEVLS